MMGWHHVWRGSVNMLTRIYVGRNYLKHHTEHVAVNGAPNNHV